MANGLISESAQAYLANDKARTKLVQTTIGMYSKEVYRHVRADDKPGMFLPLMFPNGRGGLVTGCVLALKDRAIFVWDIGRIGVKLETMLVPYGTVRAVESETIDTREGPKLQALRITTDDRELLVYFPLVAFDPMHRGVLSGALDGSLKLGWEDSESPQAPPPAPSAPPAPRRLGANVSTETSPNGGVEVHRVQPGSLAARAGLQPGDCLIQIGERAISSAADIQIGLSDAPDPVGISYRRGSETRVTSVSIS